MKQSFDTMIRFFSGDEIFQGKLHYTIENGIVTYKFQYYDREIIVTNDFPFLALTDLRLQLEKEHIKLICEGSRYDVHPSGMQMDGFAAWELEISKPVTKLVDILDDTKLINRIATVKEQEEFYDKWLSSFEW